MTEKVLLCDRTIVRQETGYRRGPASTQFVLGSLAIRVPNCTPTRSGARRRRRPHRPDHRSSTSAATSATSTCRCCRTAARADPGGVAGGDLIASIGRLLHARRSAGPERVGRVNPSQVSGGAPPGETRTHTGRVLNPFPLPIGIRGRRAETTVRDRAERSNTGTLLSIAFDPGATRETRVTKEKADDDSRPPARELHRAPAGSWSPRTRR